MVYHTRPLIERGQPLQTSHLHLLRGRPHYEGRTHPEED